MDNHNQHASPATKPSSKTVLSALGIIAALLLIGGASYFLATKRTNSQAPSSHASDSSQTFTFGGKEYVRAVVLPTSQDLDLTSESYEWVPKGESLAAWTSIVTTHKMAPKDKTKPISAKIYAENIASLNEKQGAVIIETSVINTPEAVKEAGIDPNNPPYLIVYAYPSSTSTPIEVDMQKVINGPDGIVEAFVYAFPLKAQTQKDVTEYFQSQKFVNMRTEVIKATFPY